MKPGIFALSLLGGCVFIGENAHQRRIDDALAHDTDTDTDTDPGVDGSAPVVEEPTFRFHFDDAANYEGVWLAFRATDVDGDLTGGAVVVDGGDPIPLSSVQAHQGDWFSVPVEHTVVDPCDPPARTVLFTVQDAEGNTSTEHSVSLVWNTFLHDESNTPASDANEPVISGVTYAELPVAICGYKGEETEFHDYWDDIQLLPGADRRIQAVANFTPGSDTLYFGLIVEGYGTTDILAQQGNSAGDVGVLLNIQTPANPIPHYLTVWGGNDPPGDFRTGYWTVYVHPALPPVLP
ncbi:MAG: hypothetical protein R3F61_02370 [Myxococcota bacterium]